jgi:hypothetical protein
MYVDWIFMDMPRGKVDKPYDVLMDKEALKKVLLMAKMMNENEAYGVSVMCYWLQTGEVHAVFGELEIKDIQPYYWMQTIYDEPLSKRKGLYHNGVNTGVIGFFPSLMEFQKKPMTINSSMWNYTMTEVEVAKVVDDSGNDVNAHELPYDVWSPLLESYVPPGGTALIIGAGVGGEMVACIKAGVNVVVIEKDNTQFGYLQTVCVSLDSTGVVALAIAQEQKKGGQKKLKEKPKCKRCKMVVDDIDMLYKCGQCEEYVCSEKCLDLEDQEVNADMDALCKKCSQKLETGAKGGKGKTGEEKALVESQEL